MTMPEFHERALAKLGEWAKSDENIRAMILTGSGARDPKDFDELSDLDIELYVRDPAQLLTDASWYSQFGHVLAVEALPNPDWHPTRLVYYQNGKIDFMIAGINELRGTTYERTFRVLVDKDSLTHDLKMSVPKANSKPTKEEFDECINWFWAAALMCAKCIVRKEAWMAKARDWDAKTELLRMIEWDHKSRYGWDYDTWYLGKKLYKWMDEDVRNSLESCWSGFPLKSQQEGLVSTIELFEKLSTRLGAALHLKGADAGPACRAEVMRILNLANK